MLILPWWGSTVIAMVLPYVGWAEREDPPRLRRLPKRANRAPPVAIRTGGELDPVAVT